MTDFINLIGLEESYPIQFIYVHIFC